MPGSHKGRLPLPRPKTTACDLPQVIHMQAKAGTVIMYTGTVRQNPTQASTCLDVRGKPGLKVSRGVRC